MLFVPSVFVSAIFLLKKKDYKEIKHSFYICHGSKNLLKKNKVSQFSLLKIELIEVIMAFVRKLKNQVDMLNVTLLLFSGWARKNPKSQYTVYPVIFAMI